MLSNLSLGLIIGIGDHGVGEIIASAAGFNLDTDNIHSADIRFQSLDKIFKRGIVSREAQR